LKDSDKKEGKDIKAKEEIIPDENDW